MSYATFAGAEPVVSSSRRKGATSIPPGSLGSGPADNDYEREADQIAKTVLSESQAEVESFKHNEDMWRTAATVALNYYTDHGPDEGRRGFDELLNSDQYGGRLKQIRQILGG